MSADKLQLSDFLVALRSELQTAQAKAANEDLKFAIENIEVEAQITASQEDHASGGIKFWVLNAEGGEKLSSQVVHKVKLSMKPMLESGGDLKVSGKVNQRPD